MHRLTVGLLGAAAVAAGLLLIRQHRAPSTPEATPDDAVPAGETRPVTLSLERLRAGGL
jgi:hypothetical protein